MCWGLFGLPVHRWEQVSSWPLPEPPAHVPATATCPQQWLLGHHRDSEAQRGAGSPHLSSFPPGRRTPDENLLRAAEAPRTTGNLSFLETDSMSVPDVILS